MAIDMDPSSVDSNPDQTEEVDNTDHHDDTKKVHLIQVTNLSPSVDLEHMQTLFGFLGEISKIQLYDFDIKPEISSKVCFVEFANPESVSMARHLTNTTFIDRALVITPCDRSEIPDKETARTELQSLLLSEASEKNVNLKSPHHHSRPSDQSRDRDRHRERERHHSSRRLSPREPRSYRSSKSRDRELSSRHRSRSPRGDRISRRSKSRERSTRRRSRSRESKRRRSRSRDSSSRSSRHHRPSRR